jgi:hypothetical protein
LVRLAGSAVCPIRVDRRERDVQCVFVDEGSGAFFREGLSCVPWERGNLDPKHDQHTPISGEDTGTGPVWNSRVSYKPYLRTFNCSAYQQGSIGPSLFHWTHQGLGLGGFDVIMKDLFIGKIPEDSKIILATGRSCRPSLH